MTTTTRVSLHCTDSEEIGIAVQQKALNDANECTSVRFDLAVPRGAVDFQKGTVSVGLGDRLESFVGDEWLDVYERVHATISDHGYAVDERAFHKINSMPVDLLSFVFEDNYAKWTELTPDKTTKITDVFKGLGLPVPHEGSTVVGYV